MSQQHAHFLMSLPQLTSTLTISGLCCQDDMCPPSVQWLIRDAGVCNYDRNDADTQIAQEVRRRLHWPDGETWAPASMMAMLVLLRAWGVVGWAASPTNTVLPCTRRCSGSLSKMALMKGVGVACTDCTRSGTCLKRAHVHDSPPGTASVWLPWK